MNLHCVAFHTVATPTVRTTHRVPARNTARLESLATLKRPQLAGSSNMNELLGILHTVSCVVRIFQKKVQEVALKKVAKETA